MTEETNEKQHRMAQFSNKVPVLLYDILILYQDPNDFEIELTASVTKTQLSWLVFQQEE